MEPAALHMQADAAHPARKRKTMRTAKESAKAGRSEAAETVSLHSRKKGGGEASTNR
jgi:hypothetical protein